MVTTSVVAAHNFSLPIPTHLRGLRSADFARFYGSILWCERLSSKGRFYSSDSIQDITNIHDSKVTYFCFSHLRVIVHALTLVNAFV